MALLSGVLTKSFRLTLAGASRCLATNPKVPQVPEKQVPVEEFLQPSQTLPNQITVKVEDNLNMGDLTGLPEEHIQRRVRIFKPAREATQTGWNNTKSWKIEFDNKERWENPLIGWSSNSDPLSNISMALKFASADDAVRFCVKNGWEYEVETPQERKIKPKQYGTNFSWDKKTRVGTK